MIHPLALIVALVFGFQDTGLDRFSFCRESPGGAYVEQCFEIDGNGEGVFRYTPIDADTIEVPFAFSDYGRARFDELLGDTDYLAEADRYPSDRRVANMGTKTMVAEGAWGRREAAFNYSQVDEAADLATFFERLITQEMIALELDIALDFDRLGIPGLLESVEREIRANRIADPGRMIEILERVESQQGVVNYAREIAAEMKEDLIDRMD